MYEHAYAFYLGMAIHFFNMCHNSIDEGTSFGTKKYSAQILLALTLNTLAKQQSFQGLLKVVQIKSQAHFRIYKEKGLVQLTNC